MSMTAFFSDSRSVLQRSVDVKGQSAILTDISEHYELERCAEFIRKNGFKKVALQFPDDLLSDSAAVTSNLQSCTSAIIFILGDTSYGSCCVDEVAAQHGDAEAIIHFGPACLSPVKRLPVLYVYGQGQIDLDDCCKKICSLVPCKKQHILILSDVIFAYKLDEIQARLLQDRQNLVISLLATPEVTCDNKPCSSDGVIKTLSDQCNSDSCCSKGVSGQESLSQKLLESAQSNDHNTDKCFSDLSTCDTKNSNRQTSEVYFGRTFNLKKNSTIEDYVMFYIGNESRTLTNFMMIFNKNTFYTYNPWTCIGRQETLNVNRALMRRYHLIEKAKDAKVVGIVAGTLGIANYLDIISHLKSLLLHAGKKCYVFVVGKLNVAKLANFMEVDAYVLVACPEHSLLDSKDFYRPVVTPFEMEIACNEARKWTGEYIIDFQQLLPGADRHVAIPVSTPSMERTDVSLITGGLRSLGNRDKEDEDNELAKETKALMSRDETLTVSQVHGNASEFLGGRSWQGLEQKLGETPVTMAAEGRRGIAASYTHEHLGQ